MKRLGLLIVLGVIFLAASSSIAYAQNRIASRFGEAVVGNQRVMVHVTVAVPPGLNGNDVAEDALRGQGARPFQPAEFTTTGLVWDQFFNSNVGDDEVQQNYNNAGAPVGALASITNSEDTWTEVNTAKASFAALGTTNRCPSLVKECPGPQAFDGFNDIGWAAISGCCTLAITWSGTGIDEADMAVNSRFQWTTSGGNGYDLETVLLHENGHVWGLGHSPVSGAIMEATYAGVRRSLHVDDERGVTYLYPESGATGSITGTVTGSSGSAIAGAKVTVPNFPNSATTDATGAYSLDGVPAIGSYSVTASAEGYSAATLDGVLVPASNVTFILQSQSGGGGSCTPRGKGSNCK